MVNLKPDVIIAAGTSSLTSLSQATRTKAFVAAFKEGLQKLGWIDGHNVRIELRWAGADGPARIPRSRARSRRHCARQRCHTSTSPLLRAFIWSPKKPPAR